MARSMSTDNEDTEVYMLRMIIGAMLRDMTDVANSPYIDDSVVIRKLRREGDKTENLTLRMMVQRYEWLLTLIGIGVSDECL